jgi:hypothetical protein
VGLHADTLADLSSTSRSTSCTLRRMIVSVPTATTVLSEPGAAATAAAKLLAEIQAAVGATAGLRDDRAKLIGTGVDEFEQAAAAMPKLPA